MIISIVLFIILTVSIVLLTPVIVIILSFLPFIGLFVRFMRDNWEGDCEDFFATLVILAVVGFPTFMIAILIQEVFVKGEDDPPFSGGLELASYIVYGLGSFIIGIISVVVFIFGNHEG